MEVDVRRRRFTRLSNALSVMDTDELRALVDRELSNGWGASQATAVGDEGVFVKRVPVTALEYERLYSTKNHFRLPLYYQYGVGSAGFGACRELATHVKTTNWVLDGSCTGFPLLLHHRITPRVSVTEVGPDSWIAGGDYVKYWNGSKRIGTFIRERAYAPYELWLVLEWIPHTLHEWVAGEEAQRSVGPVVDELLSTLAFLHGMGVFHFDAHWGNVVTSASSVFLTDFGLASDRAFALSEAERAFIAAHEHYDYGEVIYSLGAAMVGMAVRLDADARAALVRRYVPDGGPLGQDVVIDVLVRNIDDIVSEGVLGVTPAYAAVVSRYADVILFMNSFFGAMRANRRKNTAFDDSALRALLVDVGVELVASG